MGIETLFAMGGVLVVLGILGMGPHVRRRVRSTRRRLFHAAAATVPVAQVRQP
jgi:hypothetical protein